MKENAGSEGDLDEGAEQRAGHGGLAAFDRGPGLSPWKWFALWLLAFVPTLVYTFEGGPLEPSDDSREYLRLGAILAETGTFADESGAPVAYWPPGMPALVAAVRVVFGPDQMALTIVNLVLVAVLLVLTARVGWLMAGARVGATAMVLCGLLWDMLRQPPLVLSELPYTVLLLATFLLFFEPRGRWRWAGWFAGGALLGVGVLVRSTAMLWLPFAAGCLVLWPWWGWRRKVMPLALIAVAFAGFLLPVGWWTARNQEHFGFFFPISLNSGENLALANNRFGTIGYIPPDDPRRVAMGINTGDPALNYVNGRAEFYRTWQEMPLDSALRCIPRLYYTMFRFQPWFANREILRNPFYEVIETTFAFQWFVYMGLMVAGMAFTPMRRRPPMELAVLCLMIYWLALHSMILCDPRYRYPMVPLLLPYAGHLLVNVLPRWRQVLSAAGGRAAA